MILRMMSVLGAAGAERADGYLLHVPCVVIGWEIGNRWTVKHREKKQTNPDSIPAGLALQFSRSGISLPTSIPLHNHCPTLGLCCCVQKYARNAKHDRHRHCGAPNATNPRSEE